MGLLDDAIREHLELKRRRGADASELARLEKDAFGPVGRDEAPPVADAAPAAADEAPAEPPPVRDDPPVPDPVVADPAPTVTQPGPEPIAAEPEPSFTEHVAEEPVEDELEPELPDAQSTVAFSLEDVEAAEAPTADPTLEPEPGVVAGEEDPGEHDELEETPEFLQETPEHDRLWFEQKPPRDFDF